MLRLLPSPALTLAASDLRLRPPTGAARDGACDPTPLTRSARSTAGVSVAADADVALRTSGGARLEVCPGAAASACGT